MSISIAPTETITSSSFTLEPFNGQEQESQTTTTSCVVVHQRPISVTLDGTAIFILSLGVVLLIHFVDSYIAEVLVSLIPIVLLVHNDYTNFLGLGPGGLPQDIMPSVDMPPRPLQPPKPDPNRLPREGILSRKALPYRPGPRPLVAGIAPQRQLDQHGSRRCYLALRRVMEGLGQQKPLKFGTERSCLEKHGLALFARHPLQTNCQGEICHVHDSDHSMHMCLHPDDIKEILQKGWGQRHPLAREERFLKMPVSQDFVMIYAPRDDQELQIVCRIISAAIWYILAEEVEMSTK
ncbi:hypothetical protein PT974_09103 [Cladobotryum mycophilum]|uniref:Luciferase domain-containing protein n=1 Tax=Cladobotryum mycophilum TaxID=491253 RepID=A0ABR0SGH1_9HYPO